MKITILSPARTQQALSLSNSFRMIEIPYPTQLLPDGEEHFPPGQRSSDGPEVQCRLLKVAPSRDMLELRYLSTPFLTQLIK